MVLGHRYCVDDAIRRWSRTSERNIEAAGHRWRRRIRQCASQWAHCRISLGCSCRSLCPCVSVASPGSSIASSRMTIANRYGDFALQLTDPSPHWRRALAPSPRCATGSAGADHQPAVGWIFRPFNRFFLRNVSVTKRLVGRSLSRAGWRVLGCMCCCLRGTALMFPMVRALYSDSGQDLPDGSIRLPKGQFADRTDGRWSRCQ